MSLNVAIVILCILILLCVIAKDVASDIKKDEIGHGRVLCNKVVWDGFPPEYPAGSKLKLLNAAADNTLTQRPGNSYEVTMWKDPTVKQVAYTIKLLYKPSCTAHPLCSLYEDIAKTMMADGTSSTASIEFVREIVDSTNPLNLLGGFPKVIKIRHDGQVMEYKGYTNYGQLYDWILNEGILY